MKTWKVEMLVVFVVLAAVVALTGRSWLELLGALAVLAAFGNAQVTVRMAETEAAKPKPDVDCHKWAGRYFFAKELLWLAFFVAHRSWSALVGVGVFLAYPVWRACWRKRHPLKVEAAQPRKTAAHMALRQGELAESMRKSIQNPHPPDRLSLDGHFFEVLEGTTLTPGKPWVLRAKLRIGAGDQRHLDDVITHKRVVNAMLQRHGSDPVIGEAKAERGSFFRDREGRNCGSLELIGTGEMVHP